MFVLHLCRVVVFAYPVFSLWASQLQLYMNQIPRVMETRKYKSDVGPLSNACEMQPLQRNSCTPKSRNELNN